MTDPNPNWERDVLEKLALSAVVEQRRARRWGIFFKALGFLYLTFLIVMLAGLVKGDVSKMGKHTALIDLQGVIASDKANADMMITGLKDAFENTNTQGVIMRINSPGGSPVQAGQINDEIRRLRAKYPKIPFYVVVDDVCASGGYYIAAAAEKIFVDKASLVGSIGVLMDGFGFTQTMDKLGVERRLITSGVNKGFLDPFSPTDPQQVEYAKQMLEEIHAQFIQVVRQGRGKRLKETPETFSGLVWSGQKSIEMGLADGFGTVESVARDVIKAEEIVDFTPQEGIADRLVGKFGIAMANLFKPTSQTGMQLR